jgi:hypothetical protein
VIVERHLRRAVVVVGHGAPAADQPQTRESCRRTRQVRLQGRLTSRSPHRDSTDPTAGATRASSGARQMACAAQRLRSSSVTAARMPAGTSRPNRPHVTPPWQQGCTNLPSLLRDCVSSALGSWAMLPWGRRCLMQGKDAFGAALPPTARRQEWHVISGRYGHLGARRS